MIAETQGLESCKSFAKSQSGDTGRKLLNAIGLLKCNVHETRILSVQTASLSPKSVAVELSKRLSIYDRNLMLSNVIETLLSTGDIDNAMLSMTET